MKNAKDKSWLRIVDANYNRAKEGLRVCEDVCRFVENDKKRTRRWKDLRHRLTAAIAGFGLKEIVLSRDIKGDVGKPSTRTELSRTKVADILYANCQRAKESVRVLEEFAKLVNGARARELKRVRYRIYELEKEFLERS